MPILQLQNALNNRKLDQVLNDLDQDGSPGVAIHERVALTLALDFAPLAMQLYIADSIRAHCTVSRDADPPDDYKPQYLG